MGTSGAMISIFLGRRRNEPEPAKDHQGRGESVMFAGLTPGRNQTRIEVLDMNVEDGLNASLGFFSPESDFYSDFDRVRAERRVFNKHSPGGNNVLE